MVMTSKQTQVVQDLIVCVDVPFFIYLVWERPDFISYEFSENLFGNLFKGVY